MTRSFARILACLACLPAIPLAPAMAQEVVQPLAGPATEELNDALRRLSRNPESVPALVAAGRASLALNDMDAALGFFSRAQSVDPDDTRVLIGLALIAVQRGEAVTALQLFDNAEAGGASLTPHAAERGLAYDLVGQNVRAQRLYRQALSREDNPEVTRRLALSYAIAGDAEASEEVLLPMLQRQDRAAFRTRAFALAIAGREDEATAIAEAMLPARLSRRLQPFFRYMPRLTAAQQAAAANLGQFPSASEVGRDSAEIASLSGSRRDPPAPRTVSAADRLEPQGAPLGPSTSARRSDVELPAIGSSPPTAASSASPQEPAAQVAAQGAQPTPQREPDARPEPALAAAAEASSSPQEEPVVIDLAAAFSDFDLERRASRANPDAVDITAIDPPRERPAPAPPAPPPEPARHWVQVATGQDTSAFRFDWRRIVRNGGDLLDDAEAFTAPWGQTNRLLTGPFDSASQAQDMVSALAGEGVDSFRYSSQEGERIQALD